MFVMPSTDIQRQSASGPIAKLTRVRAALEKAKTLDDVVDVLDQSKAIVTYAKAIGMSQENVNAAVEVKLRAERKAGGLLAEMRDRGDRDAGKGGDRKSRLHDATVKLDSLGVTKDQSHRWQKISVMPEVEFTAFICEVNESGKELTTAGVLREWSSSSRQSNGPTLSQGDSLASALERLHKTILRIYGGWPKDDRSSLSMKLRDYADQIESHGGLAL